VRLARLVPARRAEREGHDEQGGGGHSPVTLSVTLQPVTRHS
jgi:hypothetical protein